jgi:hypothetical protein
LSHSQTAVALAMIGLSDIVFTPIHQFDKPSLRP